MSHAIVIGSSIAGITAAHVLTNHFDKVTVIDRDSLSDAPEYRRGVPQNRHPHVVLRKGLDILEQYFPGLTDELLAAESIKINFGDHTKFFIFGGWRKTYHSSVETVACSRPLLESTAYRHLRQNPRIEVIAETEVIGLCVDDNKTRVQGVQLRSRSTRGDNLSSLQADLVVDASGRDSKVPEWLESLGYSRPEEIEVNAQAAYASRVYEVPEDMHYEWRGMMIQPSAPNTKRGALILGMENNYWHVVMMGIGGDVPPTDEAGFLEFARSLPTPDFYEVLQKAKPVGPIYGYRRTENRLRHYDRLPRYLENLLVMGDAVCSFNPMYGQGMSVASMESLTLDECVRDHLQKHPNRDLTGLAQKFQKEVAGVVAMPWQLASGEDRRWMEDEKPDMPTRFMQWYIDHVLKATRDNTAVSEAFFQVQNMLAAPTLLFRPDVVAQVFLTRIRHNN